MFLLSYCNISPIPLSTQPGEVTGSKKSSNTGVIIGAAAGGCVLMLLLLGAGLYAHRQKKRAEKATEQNNPFGMKRL